MAKILFSPIGGSDPIRNFRDGSMLHICRYYLPDKVILYLTGEMYQHHLQDNRYVFTLFGAAVSWKSGLQSVVALSSTKA